VNCPAIKNTIAFASTVLDFALCCAKVVSFVATLQVHIYGSLESKSSSENRNTTNMENLKLAQDFKMQNEKPVSGLLPVQSVNPEYTPAS